MKIAVAGGTGTIGRQVVDCARQAGHETIVLSRANGVDVRTDEELALALTGVDVVIDVTNSDTIEEHAASEFFVDVAGALQRAADEADVKHIVTLSIVGIDESSFGYYKAKLEHERAAADGNVPSTIMRATQMHELPVQLMAITRKGDEASVFDLHVQTVAARTAGSVLVQLAEGPALGRAPDLAGPKEADLVDLAREFVEYRHLPIKVHVDKEAVMGIPTRALLPKNGARIEGPSFEEWLSSEDAAKLKV